MSTFARGDAVVPRALVEPVRRALAEDGAAGRAVVTVHAGPEPDRAYYLVAHGDIAEAAVASLAVGDDLRFEIEEGEDA
ncbi:MAG: hypothetical protein R3B99_00020 [Polyangiales bacterium]